MSIDVQPEPPIAEFRRVEPATASATPPKRQQSGSIWKRALLAIVVLAALGAAAPFVIRTMAPESGTQVLTHTIARDDLVVSIIEDGTLESSNNKEIKCRVKGGATVIWVVESGTEVKPGDELVRLDTSTIEDNISTQTIAYQNALAAFAQAESDVAVADISITEYLQGTFRSELKTAESNVAIAEENLRVAQNVLEHAKKMFRKGYVSKLEMDSNSYAVEHARLELDVMKTQLEVLEKFTKPKMLEELNATLSTAKASLESSKAALDLEKARLEREKKQLEHCVVTAESAGIVIYPSAAEWKREPDIEAGANVREDQVLLMMPDVNQMQVKLGIHEAKIDRVAKGTRANIELQEMTIQGEVSSVASIAKPGGWWSGNVVKYDTIVTVDPQPGLKPGMSANVQLILAEHRDVVTIPVAAVLEQQDGFYCWVKNGPDEPEKTRIELGDSNEQFIVVDNGVTVGDKVVLNPLDFVDEAQAEALKPSNDDKDVDERSITKTPPVGVLGGKAAVDVAGRKKAAAGKPDQQTVKTMAKQALKDGDKNGDGVLTKDEFSEETKPHFEKTDTDGNGKVDTAEIEAGLKQSKQAVETRKS